MFIKYFIISLAVVILGSLGCAPKPTEPGVSLTVWHWMTDRENAFQELARRYREKSGIKVNFELYAPSDDYAQKVRAAAQGQNLPDIFGVLEERREFSSFIKAGHILELTPYMEENSAAWKNSFFPKALAVNEFSAGNAYGIKSGIFGVPIDVMTIEMVYNKGLLHKIGFRQPPQTFTELLEVGRRLKENNLQGLISGWGEVWLINCFANGYAFNLMGKDKLLATIRGEVAYTDPDWVKVLELFQKMRDSGLFYNGIVTMVNKTAEQLFANEKAVFAFNGSWCVNVYRGMNPDLDYGVILPPKASEAFPMSIWGGAGSSFMVNSRSARKEEAVKFLRWLTERDQQAYLSEATNNLPANRHSLSRIPEVLAQFSQGMDYATHPNIWGVSEFPAVLEALGKGIQLIIIGEKTPEQVAAEAQRVKERELAKKK